jgi:ribosome-binding ATPase YchF (GTP1/OBG family)
MKIGIVGYQGCGKSTLFQWLTGVVPNPSHAHEAQMATAAIPEPRVPALCDVYHPKKITEAHLEIVDTPGLSRTHEGSAQKLALIREAGCLIVVVAAFDGGQALADLQNFEEDLLIADLDIVSGRVERLKDQIKKPRPNREELQKELDALLPLLAVLESGRTLHDVPLTAEQKLVIRAFQLFSDKPRLIVVNLADDDADPDRFVQQGPAGFTVVPVSLSLQLGLSEMNEPDRADFCQEMGVQPMDRGALLRQIMTVSGQMLFFTAGEKEVRTWLIRQGGTALEAAAGVHTDLAQGFIRAEVMTCDDLIRLGSEREVKAQHLLRKEHKDYVIQDGDIVFIQHN